MDLHGLCRIVHSSKSASDLRRERDSNPRGCDTQGFSRASHSAALPSLRNVSILPTTRALHRGVEAGDGLRSATASSDRTAPEVGVRRPPLTPAPRKGGPYRNSSNWRGTPGRRLKVRGSRLASEAKWKRTRFHESPKRAGLERGGWFCWPLLSVDGVEDDYRDDAVAGRLLVLGEARGCLLLSLPNAVPLFALGGPGHNLVCL
jgi:hypothetical protein